MIDRITFSVDRKLIRIYGQEFTLGELSVQILNTPSCRIQEMYDLLRKGRTLAQQYEDIGDYALWFQANDAYLKLETLLREYPLLDLLQRDWSVFWETTVLTYKDWPVYREYFSYFKGIVTDISFFHTVIGHFIRNGVMPIQALNSGSISEAVKRLTDNYYPIYLRDEKKGYLYAYHRNKPITLDFEPGNVASASGDFQIVETYTSDDLLMLLKIDFYKALEAGHLIRQCEYCGRFFLLTKRLHTKYCDNPAPDNPKYTCAQMGYRLTRRKETPEDDPKMDALRRCLQRITKDCSRGIITGEEKISLKAKAEELYHAAKIHSGITYADFEKSLESQNLYPLCGVKRKSNPVGHPKKEPVRS